MIEAIRSSNNDEFFEAMESGKILCVLLTLNTLYTKHTLPTTISCIHVHVYTRVYEMYLVCVCCVSVGVCAILAPCLTISPLSSLVPGFDVNFMDDVGQTLLNWAAAFGSFEMVNFIHHHRPIYIHA